MGRHRLQRQDQRRLGLGDVSGFSILPGSDDVYNSKTGQWDKLATGPNYSPNCAYLGWGVYVMARVDSLPSTAMTRGTLHRARPLTGVHDRVDQVSMERALLEVRVRARGQGVVRRAVEAAAAHDQHPQVRVEDPEALRRLDPAHAGKADVDERHVDIVEQRMRERRAGRPEVVEDDQPLVGLEQRTQHEPEAGVVLDEENADRIAHWLLLLPSRVRCEPPSDEGKLLTEA